jgi:hypothetical protein
MPDPTVPIVTSPVPTSITCQAGDFLGHASAKDLSLPAGDQVLLRLGTIHFHGSVAELRQLLDEARQVLVDLDDEREAVDQ